MKAWLRRLGFARGPLRRRSDRAEIAFLVATALMVLTVVPIWIAVNDPTADYFSQLSADRAAHGQLVDAVLTANVPGNSSEYSSAGQVQVAATWIAPAGTPRSGGVPADPGTRAGTHVPLWTDQAGEPAPAPFAPADINDQAAIVALIAATIWLVVVAVATKGVYALLERRRLASWGWEWERVEPGWRARQ